MACIEDLVSYVVNVVCLGNSLVRKIAWIFHVREIHVSVPALSGVSEVGVEL